MILLSHDFNFMDIKIIILLAMRWVHLLFNITKYLLKQIICSSHREASGYLIQEDTLGWRNQTYSMKIIENSQILKISKSTILACRKTMEAQLKLEYSAKDAISKLLSITVQFASMHYVKSVTVSSMDLKNYSTTIEPS